MDKKEWAKHWNVDKALHYIYINEIIFVVLVLLCFIGELLAEVTDRVAFFYWFCVTPIFFYCSYLSEQAKAISIGKQNSQLMRYELFYWGSAMIAVFLIFLMWHANAIQPGAAALTIHVMLAHTMFLSGVVLGTHYFLIGAILFLTAGLSILFSGAFGLDLVLSLPFIALGFYLEENMIFPFLKEKHDFMQELSEDQQKAQPAETDSSKQ